MGTGLPAAGADNAALRRAVLSQLEEDSLALPCRSQAQCIAATRRVVEVLAGMAAALEEQVGGRRRLQCWQPFL